MRKHIVILLLLVIGTPSLQARSDVSSSAHEQIEQALKDFGNLKVGMTRQDVEVYFTLDGGMNWRGETRYVYHKCDLIKVKITFELDPKMQNDFSVHDKVTKLSKLYLEYPSMD